MAVAISYKRATSLNEKLIVSDLLGTLFELVFSLIVVLNSVFSHGSILSGILITIILIITFSIISGFNKLLSTNLFFREISFLISYIFLLILIPSHLYIVFLTFILFAFGNSVLGVCKSKQKCNKLLFRNFDAGLIIFMSISFLVLLIFLLNRQMYLVKENYNGIFYRIFDFSENVLMISVVAAIVNNFKNKVLRNFLFPVITAVLLFISFSNGNKIVTGNLEIAFAASILISVISYKLKFLTAEGAQYQFILAFLILGLGGWKWAIPILVFFITSSLLSGIKTNSKKKRNYFLKKTASGILCKFWQTAD